MTYYEDAYYDGDNELCCPECKTNALYYDKVFGFYKCENCSVVWGHDKDDPDYDDDLLQELEANQIAESRKESDSGF